MESQKAKRQRTGENQNEEESNSQANIQDRTSGEDSTRMENELRNIICRFEVPRVIMSDNGKHFDNPKFQKIFQDLGIKNHYVSKNFPRLRSKKPLLFSKTPSGQ